MSDRKGILVDVRVRTSAGDYIDAWAAYRRTDDGQIEQVDRGWTSGLVDPMAIDASIHVDGSVIRFQLAPMASRQSPPNSRVEENGA